MALPLYLAQTQGEMSGNLSPLKIAYMACHFSPGGSGLSNLPKILPPGTMLILDDSTPMEDHSPEKILLQLTDVMQRSQCEALLLDFQRPGIDIQQKLAHLLCQALPFPVGVSEIYGTELSCPVFLPPVPPDGPLAAYILPWQGREIWLEGALDGLSLHLTEAGCHPQPLWDFPDDGCSDSRLHCHYRVETTGNTAAFHLWRTPEDLKALFREAEYLGVSKIIGLWQELRRIFPEQT